jgi:hypothetical protein
MENIYRDYFNATEVPTGCDALSKQFDYEDLIGFAKHYANGVNENSVLGDVMICDNCDKTKEVNCLCEVCLKSVISKGN